MALAVAASASAQRLMTYPAKGQSPRQQVLPDDDRACLLLATGKVLVAYPEFGVSRTYLIIPRGRGRGDFGSWRGAASVV